MREQYDMMARAAQPPMAAYAPSPLAAELPAEHAEPSLLKPVLRHWWIVIFIAAIFLAVAAAYNKNAQLKYTSYAKIYIEPSNSNVDSQIGAGSERQNYLATQVEAITSTPILERVLATPGITDLKTFQESKMTPLMFLRNELQAELERKTDIIVISFTSPYPEDAKKVVDAAYESFKSVSTEEKDDLTKQRLDFIQDEKTKADEDVKTALEALRTFTVQNPTIDTQNTGRDLVSDDLRQVSARLTQAQLDLANMEATYGRNSTHQLVVRARDALNAIQDLYDEKVAKLSRQRDKTADLQLLQANLQKKQDFAKRLGDEIQQLNTLVAGRNLIDIRLIEPAHVADFASFPRKKRILAVAGVLGGLLGAGLALLRDRLDGRLRSVNEVEEMLGLPILGVVPAMSGRRTAVARAMTVHLDPRSVVAEAYRTIRTAVYFGSANPCKTVLLTSPEPGDGKTTCASNLSIAIAQTGRSVLLLDADFRKPTQHKNLDIKDSVGLSSVLAGQATLDRAIQHTSVEGLDILPCGPIPANPSEILNSREFGELIDNLAARYDHILFDSPPVNPVTDARILGAVSDATILVLRADKSTRRAAEYARNALFAVNAQVLGVIVNDAPRSRGYDVYGGYYYGSPDRAPSAGVIPQNRQIIATPGQPPADDTATPPAQPPPQSQDPRRRSIA